MRWLVVVVIGCASSTTPSTTPEPASQRQPLPSAQSVREGLALLCSSSWNGELHGPPIHAYLPDALRVITNEEVFKLMAVLPSPDIKRADLFDGFLAENHIDPFPCPFRERLPYWSRDPAGRERHAP